jgi:hypothetical protein
MNIHKKRVYSVSEPKKPEDCMALTPAEALMYNLKGIRLIDMTEKHGMTVQRLMNSRKDTSHERYTYGSIFRNKTTA